MTSYTTAAAAAARTGTGTPRMGLALPSRPGQGVSLSRPLLTALPEIFLQSSAHVSLRRWPGSPTSPAHHDPLPMHFMHVITGNWDERRCSGPLSPHKASSGTESGVCCLRLSCYNAGGRGSRGRGQSTASPAPGATATEQKPAVSGAGTPTTMPRGLGSLGRPGLPRPGIQAGAAPAAPGPAAQPAASPEPTVEWIEPPTMSEPPLRHGK